MTEVRRINMSDVENLDQAITDLCDVMLGGGLKLSSSFVVGNQLVLCFRASESCMPLHRTAAVAVW